MLPKNDIVLVDEVASLLDDEREALLKGDMQAIEAMLPRKTELTEKLMLAGERELKELSGLRNTALRNQELLDEALKGIRSVADRVAELRRVKEQLDTYNAFGEKQSILTNTRSVERRA